MYINVGQQELATCKRIGYDFFSEEPFVVRHKSVHSCKSTIFFDLDKDIIKCNCNFIFYYNKTDVTLTVLDGGNEIFLANWPTINTLFVPLIMIYQLKFQVIHMFW